MSQTLHPMLNIAVRAARAAGAIINRAALDPTALRVASKGVNDFVTEVDQAAEQAIIETVLEAYPGHAILGEETGRTHGKSKSDYLWIIDPLDGTTNFIHGLPIYAVSIALSYRGKIEQAVVYDPARNDLFYASKGRGAYLNDKRLRVSRRVRLGEALIGTGFPFRKGDNFPRYLKIFESVMTQCAGLRRPGSAALDLCYVAAGWYDGFFEIGLSPWDVAAGSLIVTEAGGLVGNFTGEAEFMEAREIVAAAPRIYGQLVTILAPHTGLGRPPGEVQAEPDSLSARVAQAALTPVEALSHAVAAGAPAGAAGDAGDGAVPADDAPAAEAPPARKAIRIRAPRVEADGAAASPTGDDRATGRPRARTSQDDPRAPRRSTSGASGGAGGPPRGGRSGPPSGAAGGAPRGRAAGPGGGRGGDRGNERGPAGGPRGGDTGGGADFGRPPARGGIRSTMSTKPASGPGGRKPPKR